MHTLVVKTTQNIEYKNMTRINFDLYARQLLIEYSKKAKIPKNYFTLLVKRGNKFVRSQSKKQAYAVRKGRWITINLSVFEYIAKKSLVDAKKMLRFVLAHEITHYKSKIESVADIFAETYSGVSVKEFNRIEKKYLKKLKKNFT